jgi:hypothetical protein
MFTFIIAASVGVLAYITGFALGRNSAWDEMFPATDLVPYTAVPVVEAAKEEVVTAEVPAPKAKKLTVVSVTVSKTPKKATAKKAAKKSKKS